MNDEKILELINSLEPEIKRMIRTWRFRVPGYDLDDFLQEARLVILQICRKDLDIIHTSLQHYLMVSVYNRFRRMAQRKYVTEDTDLLEIEDEVIDAAETPSLDRIIARDICLRCFELAGDSPSDMAILTGILEGEYDSEIGRRMGVSRQAIAVRRHRLLARLRKQLTSEGYAP